LFVVYLAMLPVAETASTLSDRAVNEYWTEILWKDVDMV
jgi:hypothetical protein